MLGFQAILLWLGGSEFVLCWIVGFVLHYLCFFRNVLLI